MPFAVIYIPDFPVEAIVRSEPQLREYAVAVVEGTAPLVRVVAVNEKAAQAGIEPGMTKLEAESMVGASCHLRVGSGERQPAIGNRKSRDEKNFAGEGARATQAAGTVRQRSAEREAAAHAALLDCACGFSPRVEDTAADTVALDVAGLERIFGPPAKMARDIARRCSELGLEANVAVAANVDTAVLAARGFAGVNVITEGKEAERLGELGVEILMAVDWRKSLPIVDCRLPIEKISRQSACDAKRAPTFSNTSTDEGACATQALDILETLERWGVRNLRALAALPEVAVAERLGQQGLHLQRLAHGQTRRPLVVAEPPLCFEEAVELEYPVDLLEPLAFLINRMLEQLCARLAARALSTNELRLRFELDLTADIENAPQRHGDKEVDGRWSAVDGQPQNNFERNRQSAIDNRQCSSIFERTLRLPVPMLDAKVFLKLLQLDLQAHPPPAPVRKAWLRAEPAEPRRGQNGLFVPQEPEAEKLAVTLARIERVVGKSAVDGRGSTPEARVGSPEILDTHRADGFRVRPFAASGQWPVASGQDALGGECGPTSTSITALRVFRPPLAAVVTVREGKPAHVASPERPTMRGEVVWCAGPWRSSGEWWTEQEWSRAQWDVAVRNEEGVILYRIYRDEVRGKWWVEGTYD
jgi:protein ImuB